MAAGRVSPAPKETVPAPAWQENTTPEDFIAFAVEHFCLDPHAFMKTRKYSPHEFTSIKHMVRHYLYCNYNLSLKEVGRLTRGADHSTVLNSHKKHRNYMLYDSAYRNAYGPFQEEAMSRGFKRKEMTNA